MSSELEPGQDDLVKEDKASASIKRALTRNKDPRPKDEALYTDRGNSESKRAKKMRNQDPVRDSQVSKAKGGFGSLKQMWKEAVADAEKRQGERRAKKGK